MAVSTFSSILQDILKFSSEDAPKLLKDLENLANNLKQPSYMKEFNEIDDKAQATIIQQSVESYCHALKLAKLARSVNKVLRSLPKSYRDAFILEMKIMLQHLLASTNLVDLKTLSALLDQAISAELILQNHLHCFLHLLQNASETETHLPFKMRHVKDEEYRRCYVKLCIQVLQLFPQGVRSIFSTCPKFQGCSVILDEVQICQQAWKRIITTLLSSLIQSSSQDVAVLTGTALAMTFSYAPSSEMTQIACQSVLSLLSDGQTGVAFAGLEFDLQDIVSRISDDVFVSVAAMVKGILVSSDKAALSRGHRPLLLQVFPYILQLCRGPMTHHYLAFNLLALWYQKLEYVGFKDACSFDLTIFPASSKEVVSQEMFWLKKHLLTDNTADTSKPSSFMSKSCQFLNSTLACIWPNWESAVEGVSELVVKVFDQTLRIWHQAVNEGISDYDDLCHELLSKVLSLSWHSKARYRVLCVLLKYVDCFEVVQTNRDLRADLMRCMRTNQLAAVACDVYRVCVQQITNKQSEALQIWTDLWMPTLLTGLTATDSLQPLKTCTYWLPPTLKLIAGSCDVLLNTAEQHLSSSSGLTRQRWLFAWISVSAFARELLHTFDCRLASGFLKESLLCAEDDIRIEALKLLCTSVKKSEPMGDIEVNFVKEFIPANLKTDSPAFRQNMTLSLKKMFVRIRDSCIFAVRTSETAKTFLAHSLQFIDWLHQLLMCSLIPGSCYQRRQTSLDLLTAMLDTFIYQPHSTTRKRNSHETSEILLLHAHEQGLWQFFSDEYFMTLVYCLEDGVLEVQTQCYNLLVKYFQWPKAPCDMPSHRDASAAWLCSQSPALLSLLSTDRTCAELFHRAFYLISSPRAYENHSGVMMMSLMMNRYIIRQGWTSTSSSCELIVASSNTKHLAEPTEESRLGLVGDITLAVLDLLISRMEFSLAVVMKDLGAGFHTNCLHGLTQSVTRCLLDIAEGRRKNLVRVEEIDWKQRLEGVVSLNQKIIYFVLEVLAGGQSFESCPSFAEMGVALKNLISGGQEDDVLCVSPEFQLLLSWCWLNIKESCSCLGEVTSLVVTCDRPCSLPISSVSEIGEIFVKVLTTCRHRGAIEGSRHGLYIFYSSLMASSEEDLRNIPCTILQQVLDSLTQNSLASSITRRSAGLPIIIQTVLQAAQRNGNKTLLMSTVEQLYGVASQELPTNHSQLQDLSQSHALNILKTIFGNASLAPQLMPLLSKMAVLVVEGFDSPSWTIRNAATQLISTLVTRIFGQKNSEESNSSLSLEDFSIQFPELMQFVCDKLRACTTSGASVRPSLYVVLTLLSELEISPSHQHSSRYRNVLRESVLSFIGSPVFSLRKLSAQAFVALSPLDMTDTTLSHILQKIGRRNQKLNELHGWLLSGVCLISLGTVSQVMHKAVLKFVLENKWLLFTFSSCLLPVSTLMQLVHLALVKTELDILMFGELQEMVETCILSITKSEDKFQIDKEQCLRQGVKILMQIERMCSAGTTCRQHVCQFVHRNLFSSCDYLREAIMDSLSSGPRDIIIDPIFQRNILASMTTEKHVTRLLQSADQLIDLALRGDLLLQASDFSSFDISAQKSLSESVQNSEAIFFLMETLLIGYSINSQDENSYQVLEEWCDRLLLYTEPTQNEDMRIYAARSLAIAGENVFKFCSTKRALPGCGRLLNRVIKAILQLLEDTEVEVRQLVSSLISKTQGLSSLTSNWCYPVLSSLICEEFYWSAEIIITLLDVLHTPGQLTRSISCALSARNQVLFEHEHASALSETFITQMWAYNTLQCTLTTHTDHGSHYFQQLKSRVSQALEELSSNFDVIMNNLTVSTVFNISCDKDFLSSFLGLIFLSCLQINSSKDTKLEKSDLLSMQDLLQPLLQISSLHPFLGRFQMKDSQLAIVYRFMPKQLLLIG